MAKDDKERADEQQREQQKEQQRSQREQQQQQHHDAAGQGAQAPPQPGSPQPANMKAVLEQLVDLQPLEGSGFKFACRCKKCGWQTLQQDEGQGKKLVMQHAQSHWPEIQAKMAAGGSAEGASQPNQPRQGPTAERI